MCYIVISYLILYCILLYVSISTCPTFVSQLMWIPYTATSLTDNIGGVYMFII